MSDASQSVVRQDRPQATKTVVTPCSEAFDHCFCAGHLHNSLPSNTQNLSGQFRGDQLYLRGRNFDQTFTAEIRSAITFSKTLVDCR